MLVFLFGFHFLLLVICCHDIQAQNASIPNLSIECSLTIDESYPFYIQITSNNNSVVNVTVTFNGQQNITDSSGTIEFIAPRVIPGDDITFKTKGWAKDSINELIKHNNIGLSGPINNNGRILTQAMVSRTHMDIFGWFFPPEIINWCCDDWYNWVYQPDHFYPAHSHYCSNDGGQPRYIINNDAAFTENRTTFNEKTQKLRADTFLLEQTHKKYIENYIAKIEK